MQSLQCLSVKKFMLSFPSVCLEQEEQDHCGGGVGGVYKSETLNLLPSEDDNNMLLIWEALLPLANSPVIALRRHTSTFLYITHRP